MKTFVKEDYTCYYRKNSLPSLIGVRLDGIAAQMQRGCSRDRRQLELFL